MSDHYHLERMLRQELANLHRGYLEQSRPIINQLARLEAMKPPAPVWITGDQWGMLKSGVMESITGQREPDPETPGARMRRLEHERRQLLHLLRMVSGAAPDYLADMIDATLKEMDP